MFYMTDGVSTALGSLTIPSTITSIGLNIFEYKTHGANTILTGFDAFRACSSLSKVSLNNGLTCIGSQMFYMIGRNGYFPTSLGSVTIPSTVTSIG